MPVGKNKTTFENKEYDVSMNMACWVCITLISFTFGAIPYSITISLDQEEVTKVDTNCCGKSESKRPYGELGDVTRANCCCCVGFSSSFGEVQPGCGCEAELVDEIVAELKARQRGRGDTAQIERAEQTLEQLEMVNTKLDAIMQHLNMDPAVAVPESTTMERK